MWSDQAETARSTGVRRLSTAVAAEYHPGVCKAWANEVASVFSVDTTTSHVLGTTVLSAEGRVRRHADRGIDADSAREVRRQEDEASKAGCRNPADVVLSWPALWRGMKGLLSVLAEFRNANAALRDLPAACGDDPTEGAAH